MFSYNTDAVPHLIGITNQIGTPESYTFSYTGNQSLLSPFSPPVSYGTTTLLSSVTNSINLTHSLEYAGSSGELSRVVFPYGGYIRWQHQSVTFNAGRTIREVTYRYLVKAPGSAEMAYWMWRDGNDINRDWHLGGSLFDPTGAIKNWVFYSATGSWWNGLLTGFTQQQASGLPPVRTQDFTYSQDPVGNPYIGSALTTLDPGTAYQAQSKTEQTVDAHGNVTQTKVYDFGNLTTPARTYTNTYLTDANYTSRNIWNRLVSSTVSSASQSVQLVSNQYDTYSAGGYCSSYTSTLYNMTGLRQHDTILFGTGFTYRGNVTVTDAPDGRTCFSQHITGDFHDSNGIGGTTSSTPTAATNYAAPGLITANNFSSTMS